MCTSVLIFFELLVILVVIIVLVHFRRNILHIEAEILTLYLVYYVIKSALSTNKGQVLFVCRKHLHQKMSQLSAILDESTDQLLQDDEDVKNLMAIIDDPNLHELQHCNYPLENQQNFASQYPQLPLHQTHNQLHMMPQAEQLPTSVANNNMDRVNKEEFIGDYNFKVLIDPYHAGSKSPWVYSCPLKKVFIQINTPFPVDVKVSPKEGEVLPELYVRVTPSYSSAQHSLTLVMRCLQHMQPNQNHDVPKEIWEHIIRCKNPNASYHGGKDFQTHLSVLVPLGHTQNGLDTIRNMYQFVCKNSCVSGMNRRPLDIVFTLEDKYANVLGRFYMNVRICSCPKRDKEKEEKEFYKREAALPPTKKRRAEKRPLSMTQSTSDLAEYKLSVAIPGKHNLQVIYKFIHDLMAGEMLRHGTEAPFKKTVQEINQLTRNAE